MDRHAQLRRSGHYRRGRCVWGFVQAGGPGAGDSARQRDDGHRRQGAVHERDHQDPEPNPAGDPGQSVRRMLVSGLDRCRSPGRGQGNVAGNLSRPVCDGLRQHDGRGQGALGCVLYLAQRGHDRQEASQSHAHVHSGREFGPGSRPSIGRSPPGLLKPAGRAPPETDHGPQWEPGVFPLAGALLRASGDQP